MKVTCYIKSHSWFTNPFHIRFISDESETVHVLVLLCHMTQSDGAVLLCVSQILKPLTVFRILRQIWRLFTLYRVFGPEHFLDLISSRVCISAAHYH